MSKSLYTAFIQARYCSEYLLTAHTIANGSERSPSYFQQLAEDHFAMLAEELGYSLVKRQPMTPAMLEAVGEDIAMGR